jgi:hypothetical protein
MPIGAVGEGLKPVDHAGTQRGDRFDDEFDGHRVEVRALRLAVGVKLVERGGRDASGKQAQHHSGEQVRHVELTRICGVGQDHVATKHRDRQAVAVGEAVVDCAGLMARTSASSVNADGSIWWPTLPFDNSRGFSARSFLRYRFNDRTSRANNCRWNRS